LRQVKQIVRHSRSDGIVSTLRFVQARVRTRWASSIVHPGVLANYLRYRADPNARWEPGPVDVDYLVHELASSGVQVSEYVIDVDGFRNYLHTAAYPASYYGDGSGNRQAVFKEKALEHYVSLCLLQPVREDVILDVASSSSPFAEILTHLRACRVYKQDLIFPEGVQHPTSEGAIGIIGGNAANLPLPDSYVDGMVLHCSFEMFAGDDDTGLIREAGRVLRRGGKMIILPLYLHQHYFIRTDPLANIWGVRVDYGARVAYRRDFYRIAFSRHYSVPAFVKRVVAQLGNLSLTVLVVQNEKEVDPVCYLKFIGVFERS